MKGTRRLAVLAVQSIMVLGSFCAVPAGADEGRDRGRAVILIHDVYELQNISQNLFGDYELANDIDASATKEWNAGKGFAPIQGDFAGLLDGRGFAISGLYINRPDEDFVGLFSFTAPGMEVVRNLTLASVLVIGKENVGAIVGNNSASITDCDVSGAVSGTSCVGGLAGMSATGTISGCSFSGNVSGTGSFAGGIVGAGVGAIVDCYSTGCVIGNDTVGGLAGDNWKGEIRFSSSSANVNGNSQVGGLVGYNSGNISRCFSTGNANGTTKVGGFAGYDDNANDWLGDIYDSYSTGNVICRLRSGNPGGFIGELKVALPIPPYPAGGNIVRCYSAGHVGGGDRPGGFIGKNVGAIVVDCYWDTEASGLASSAGGTGKTTAEMKKKATFAGWDFDNVWKIEEDVSYPFLREMPSASENRPPVITGIHPTNVTAGKVFIFHFFGYDPDGDPIHWNLTSDVKWIGYMKQYGVFGGNPSLSDVGTYLVTVSASDGRGGSTSATFELTVSETVQGLKWSQVPPDANLTEGDNYSASARATDGDGGTILYNLRPYPVTEGLFDDFNDDSIDPAKWIAQAEDGIVVGEQGGALVFNGTKGSGELWYPLANVTSVATTTAIHADLVSFSGTGSGYASGIVLYQDERNHVVLGPIVDPGQYGTGVVNIQLGYRTNDVWTNMGLGELGPGPHRFGIAYQAGHATFYDNDNVLYNLSIQLQDLKYHVFGNARSTGDTLQAAWDDISGRDAMLLPPGMAIDRLNGSIRWTNATAGNFSFVVSAGSMSGSVEHIFNLTVSKKVVPPPVNRAPLIAAVTAPENRTVKSSETLSFSADATDPDGDNLTFEWKENDITLSTDKSFSRKFAPGSHSLVLLIGDGHYVTTRTFNFTVAPAPKTIETKPASVPGLGAGIAIAAVAAGVALGLFWRRERR
jgi:hypothetical protein